MRIIGAIALASAALVLPWSMPAIGQAPGTCRVADTSGTPLNVRNGPQGRIIGTLRNGTIVRVSSTARDHKQQPWAQVVEGNRGRTIGWVLRDRLACY